MNNTQVDFHDSRADDINDGLSQSLKPNDNPNQRSCEACRARKIRCSRESPCSSCLRAKVECIRAETRPREKRTRILLTPQYERKIDQIDRQLNGVTRLLEDLKMNWQPRVVSMSSSIPVPSSDATPSDSTSGMVVEGDSSLAAHSVFANEFLQKIVSTDSIQDPSLDMGETLDLLSGIVTALREQTTSSETTYPHARPTQRPSRVRCEMPPIQKVIALIRIARTQRLIGAGWIYVFLPMHRFQDMCLNVYFCEDYSEADFINVNAGLYSLFSDYVSHVAGEEQEEYLSHAHKCRDNLETALSNLPLHLPATPNMILALIFAAFYAIELSKPSLSWTLSSKASELCQTLGYHRVESMKNNEHDDIEYKSFLFWSAYLIDKSLSLRLGRASNIPDWDITVPRRLMRDVKQEPVLAYFVLWVEAARCQGNIYEMLYSPKSSIQPHHVRQHQVNTLVSDLHRLEKETQETNMKWFKIAKQNSGETILNFFKTSDDVLRLSLLTLVYRAAPQPANSISTFNHNCLEAARNTLDRHLDCMALLQQKGGENYFSTYVHLTLLFAPFIPFIVIFCQIIETKDPTDLSRLQAFITSIQSAATVSEPAAKMQRLFQILYNISHRYVEIHMPACQLGGAQADPEIDTYLASIGFLAAGPSDNQQQQAADAMQGINPDFEHTGAGNGGFGAGGTNDGHKVMDPMMWMANGAQLEDWFYNNQAIVNLLEKSNVDFMS